MLMAAQASLPVTLLLAETAEGEVEREELGQVAWLAGTVTLDSGTKAAPWPLCWKWRISMGCNLPCGQD